MADPLWLVNTGTCCLLLQYLESLVSMCSLLCVCLRYFQASSVIPEVGIEALDLNSDNPPCEIDLEQMHFNRIDRLMSLPCDDHEEEVEVIRCKVKRRNHRKKKKSRSSTPSICSTDTFRSDDIRIGGESHKNLVNGACAKLQLNEETEVPVAEETQINAPNVTPVESLVVPKERTSSADSGNASQTSNDPCSDKPTPVTSQTDSTHLKSQDVQGIEGSTLTDSGGIQLSSSSTIVSESSQEKPKETKYRSIYSSQSSGTTPPRQATPIYPDDPVDLMEMFKWLDSPPIVEPKKVEEEDEVEERRAKENDFGYEHHKWDLE